MIRHEDIGVDGASVPNGSIRESMQIKPPIRVGEEAQPAIIAALNNVQRNVWQF